MTHLPVLGLVNSLRVCPSETALAVQSRDGGAELRHGVQIGGEVVQHGDHVRGKGRTLGPLLRQPIYLKINYKYKIFLWHVTLSTATMTAICNENVLRGENLFLKSICFIQQIFVFMVACSGPQFD